MRRLWKRQRDPVEDMLRTGRPEAREDLVALLAVRTEEVDRARRTSRIAFAGALTVFMVGSFASFGGLGYAAASAGETAKAVTRIVKLEKQDSLKVRGTKSAAQDQYGKQQTFTPPTPKAKPKTRVEVASVSNQQVAAASGELPFTGLGLGATALLGSALLALGVFLRRREKHDT